MSATSVYYFTDSREVGGAEEALLTLIENLDRRNWRPTLLYNPSPAVAQLPERARGLGVQVRPVPSMPLGLKGARRVTRFARELRRARPGVFHAHLSWPLAAKYALFGAVAAQVPAIVATVHLFPEFRVDRSNYLQERLLAHRIGRYIAVSNDIASRLTGTLRWPANKVVVIRNGIPLDRFPSPVDADLRARLTGPKDRPVVLTVARLDEQKGHEVLIEAAARLPEACFVLAGEGPRRPQLEKQTNELGLGDRVVFLGWRSDVPQLLAACDAFVLPSLYEGTSLALLEAMAAGKAIVGSAVGGTDEVVVDGESGLLVPPGDAAALAAALQQVLAEAQLRERLGDAARSRAESHFSASVAAQRVTGVYEDLLHQAAVLEPDER